MSEEVVNIFCDRGHPTRVATIAAFMRPAGGRWALQGPAEVDPRRPRAVRTLGHMTWIDQTTHEPRRLPAMAPRSGDRRSYSLGPCPVCRLQVDARDDRLQAILTLFHGAADVFVDNDTPEHLRLSVSRLPLSVLAASVNRS